MKEGFGTNCYIFFALACIPWAGMQAADGMKSIAKEGTERRNKDPYGMVPEDLEKFLAENEQTETAAVEGQSNTLALPNKTTEAQPPD